MFSIEFPASVNGNSAVFNMVYCCTVVGAITFGFLRYVYDQLTCNSNHPYVWVIC